MTASIAESGDAWAQPMQHAALAWHEHRRSVS
jgi:hypothetical protein